MSSFRQEPLFRGSCATVEPCLLPICNDPDEVATWAGGTLAFGDFAVPPLRLLHYLAHMQPIHQTVIEMIAPTPTTNATLPHVACRFETLTEGLDYAARGETGHNYYSVRGELTVALPYATLRERRSEE